MYGCGVALTINYIAAFFRGGNKMFLSRCWGITGSVVKLWEKGGQMQNCLQRDYKQLQSHAFKFQVCSRQMLYLHAQKLALLTATLLDLSGIHGQQRCGSPSNLLICAPEHPTDHWWVTGTPLPGKVLAEQLCCNHTGFCQWPKEMCKQIHRLFVHQTALVHRAPDW